jgi:predicted ATP-grasp superfamily ATP-dependent carboligase
MEIKGVDQLYKSVGDLRFPILAKPPVNTGGGDGILKFGSAPSLQEYLQVHELTYPLVFQEFIEGFDTGCNVLCKDGEILAYTVQKGYLYKNKPFSPQIGLSIIHDQRVFLLAKNLMRSLNWNGVANIDLIYDVTNQEYKVLEINPRYWLTTVGSMMAGVNFPKLYCDAVMGVTFEIPTYKATRFADLKGLFVSVKRDKKLLFDKEFLWEQTPLKFALKDPVPMLYHWVWRTRNILKSRFGKRPSSPV